MTSVSTPVVPATPRPPMQRWSWGYREMDRVLGTMIPGRLYVVGARPSNGKSTLVLNMLDRWSQTDNRPNILVYPTEMGKYNAQHCWAALRLGIPEDDVLQEDWKAYDRQRWVIDGKEYVGGEAALQPVLQTIQYFDQVSEGWIRFIDAGSPTFERIGRDVLEHKPEMVIVDYIQRLKPTGKQDKFAAIREGVERLQAMALSQHLAVLITSQIHRKNDGDLGKYRAPTGEDFKGAGEIEEAADVALGLFRLLKHDFTRKDENAVRAGEKALAEFVVPNTMAIRVNKHRYRGSAADQLIRLQIHGKKITDRPLPPGDAGDSWEEPGQDDLPF
jgi:replicative DNA helicase